MSPLHLETPEITGPRARAASTVTAPKIHAVIDDVAPVTDHRPRVLFSRCLAFIGRRTLKGVRAAGLPTVRHWIAAFEKIAPSPDEDALRLQAEYRAAEIKEAERAVTAARSASTVSPETRADLVGAARCAITLFLGSRIATYPYSRNEVLSRFIHGMMRRATLRQMQRESHAAVVQQIERRRTKPLPPAPPLRPPTGEEATIINNQIETMISRARQRARRPNCSPVGARHAVAHVAALEQWRTRVLAGHHE